MFFLQETLTGAATIRAYSVTQRFTLASEQRVNGNQAVRYPTIIANQWLGVRIEIMGNLIVFFAALFAVIGRDSDALTAGLVGLSISYAMSVCIRDCSHFSPLMLLCTVENGRVKIIEALQA